MTYKIIKEPKNKKLAKKLPKLNGYTITTKIKRKNFIEVNEIHLMNEDTKEEYLIEQFNRAFKRMLKIVIDIEGSDPESTGDIKIALTEIEKMKQILKEKYRDTVKTETLKKMCKKIKLLEQNLKEKMLEQERINQMILESMNREIEEEKGRGR